MIFKVDIKQFKELSMLFRGAFWSGCYKVAILLTDSLACLLLLYV